MFKITVDHAKELGPRHDIRIEFPVTFSDEKTGVMCLYYPTLEIAMNFFQDEMDLVKDVVKRYTLMDYQDLVVANFRCFIKRFPEPLEYMAHIHRWEREMWGLPVVSI